MSESDDDYAAKYSLESFVFATALIEGAGSFSAARGFQACLT